MQKKSFILTLLVLLTLLVAVGCSTSSEPQESPQSTTPEGELQRVTLYFSDNEMMGLISEEREISVNAGDNVMALAIRELSREPESIEAVVLLPLETEVLTVEVEDDVIVIDFNEKIKDNFYGGSSSEALLITSIVNTVTEFDGYRDYKVKFLINGETFDSIGGHLSADELFERQEY